MTDKDDTPKPFSNLEKWGWDEGDLREVVEGAALPRKSDPPRKPAPKAPDLYDEF